MATEDGRSIAALVCGVLSWLFCPIILAIVAIVLGSGKPDGLARAGVILGWANIIVTVGGFLVVLLLSLLGVGIGFAGFQG